MSLTTWQQEHRLPHNITIRYDSTTGTPTINALNEQDLAFGQGYLSAVHRFWSMEQQRRVASATLSEIAGASTLEIDRWICHLGIKEAVDECYTQTQKDRDYYRILESYTAGINYALTHEKKRCLGIEFTLLKHTEVRPWTTKDSIGVMTLTSWSLAGNWEEQLVRLQTLAALGPAQAAFLEVDNWVGPNNTEGDYQPLISQRIAWSQQTKRCFIPVFPVDYLET